MQGTRFQETAMSKFRIRRWPALLLGGVLAAVAQAQTARSDAEAGPHDPTQVLSDVEPLPAQDRDSTGVLLDASRMRAHQDTTARQLPDNAVKPIADRDISRLVDRTRSWDDVRDAQSTDVPAGEASGAPPEPAQRQDTEDQR
jgi:hypothetical protein